jgi:hypothetical protein
MESSCADSLLSCTLELLETYVQQLSKPERHGYVAESQLAGIILLIYNSNFFASETLRARIRICLRNFRVYVC